MINLKNKDKIEALVLSFKTIKELTSVQEISSYFVISSHTNVFNDSNYFSQILKRTSKINFLQLIDLFRNYESVGIAYTSNGVLDFVEIKPTQVLLYLKNKKMISDEEMKMLRNLLTNEMVSCGEYI